MPQPTENSTLSANITEAPEERLANQAYAEQGLLGNITTLDQYERLQMARPVFTVLYQPIWERIARRDLRVYPFLDEFRTLCVAPPPELSDLLGRV